MNMRFDLVLLASLALSFEVPCGHAQAPDYVILNGPSANYMTSWAQGINDAGHVVGEYQDLGAYWHSFLYVNGTYTTFSNPDGYWRNFNGINDNGQIVGTLYDRYRGRYQSFLYSNGEYNLLSGPAGATETFVTDINDLGQIVGFNYTALSNSAVGFIYDNGSYLNIGSPVPGATWIQPRAINDGGHVLGTYTAPDGSVRSFIYNNGLFSLIFGPNGSTYTLATGINDAMQIVGQAIVESTIVAFSYENGVYKITGLSSIAPQALNDSGQITGWDQRAGMSFLSNSFETLSTVPVPGPIAGASLPTLAILGFLLWRRRKVESQIKRCASEAV